jgi:hypothetical protein
MKTVCAVFAGLSVVSLAACAPQDPLASYPQAETVRECEVLSEADEAQARQRESNARSASTGNNALGTLIGSALGRGVNEAAVNNRLQGCIARVSGQSFTPTGGSAGSVPARPISGDPSANLFGGSNAGQCIPGRGVFQGGASICP